MTRILIVFSFLLLIVPIKTYSLGYHLAGGNSGLYKVTPYRPYRYVCFNYGPPGSANNATLIVTNGKIADSSGNFTLTSCTIDAENGGSVYIIWDCPYSEGLAEIYDGNVYLTSILEKTGPIDFYLNDEVYSSLDNYYEGTDVYVENVTVKNGGGLHLHGYRSVSVSPNFVAEKGSRLTITSGQYIPKKSIANKLQISTTNIDKNVKIEAYLAQNFPNPSKRNTTIICYIPQESQNSIIRIFDTSGYIVKEIGLTSLGFNEISLDTSDFGNGLYFYSLIVDSQIIDTKRMAISN